MASLATIAEIIGWRRDCPLRPEETRLSSDLSNVNAVDQPPHREHLPLS